jgi:proteasome assembly chaperone (PAC2) family protein
MDDDRDMKSTPGESPHTGLAVDLWEQPKAQNIYMVIGWRQWADAGSVSSGLPEYLVNHTHARPIGTIYPDGFYLFQLPGTHDLLRPVVRFEQGLPSSLDTPSNDIYFSGDNQRGIVILRGDEPHMDVDRYTASILHVARKLNVRRIVSLGGVYGELPYDRERTIHGIVSRSELRNELERLAVSLSNYTGGASIGSYLCRRAGEQGLEMIGFYAFIPAYDFTSVESVGGLIRVENDYTAWLGIMRRLNYMFSLNLDLADLEKRSRQLHLAMDAKMAEIEQAAPQLGLRDYLNHLTQEHEEAVFNPDDEFWEEKLRDLFDHLDDEQESGKAG